MVFTSILIPEVTDLQSKSLEPIIKRTQIAVWKWVQKYANLSDRFVIGEKWRVKGIFVDETLVKVMVMTTGYG